MTLNLVPKLSKASAQNICLAATGFRIIPAGYNHHQKEVMAERKSNEAAS
jgi:hypothetical protein